MEQPTLKAVLSKTQVSFLCFFMNHLQHRNHKNTAYRHIPTKMSSSEQNEKTIYWWLTSGQSKQDSPAWHQVTPKCKDLSEFVLQPY